MNETAKQPQEVFRRQAHGGVVQDNKPPRRLTAASGEPATATVPAVGNKGGTASEENVHRQLVVERPTLNGAETLQSEQVSGRGLP